MPNSSSVPWWSKYRSEYAHHQYTGILLGTLQLNISDKVGTLIFPLNYGVTLDEIDLKHKCMIHHIIDHFGENSSEGRVKKKAQRGFGSTIFTSRRKDSAFDQAQIGFESPIKVFGDNLRMTCGIFHVFTHIGVKSKKKKTRVKKY